VSLKQKIVENKEKVKKTMQLPYLVSNIVEIVDPTEEDQQEDGATADMDAARKSKAVVIKTTTRQVQIACYFF
jgi:ATP-dependent 26S proteasome regulatory subunit